MSGKSSYEWIILCGWVYDDVFTKREVAVFFGLNKFSKKKKEPMSKYHCTTVQSYNSSKDIPEGQA